MKGSVFWTFLLHIILFIHGNKAKASQPYRTSYHFQPPKNWMNDPNGPMYYKGVYHLFYQHNPYAAVAGNISWAHSISYNLIDWMHLDNAINPTKPYDINGCWSGSATILPGVKKPIILYTGDNFKNQQVQNLAVPKNMSDPLLREWVKSGRNPVMTPGNGIDPMMYRDPTTAWRGSDKIWRVIIGGQINGHGTAILYKSKDFVNWIRSKNPLHSSNKTGMWECPDFYPVSSRGKKGLDSSFKGRDTKHVLKASFGDHDYYVIGNYESKMDRYSADVDFMDSIVQLRYDYGMFYASKSFYDSHKKRRILWGWVTEADSKSDDINKGWSGIQSIPRTILLDKTGKQLVQWPIKELEKLRARQVSLHNIEIKGGTVFEISGITASQADVEVLFELPRFKDQIELMDTKSVDPQQLCSQKNASVRGVLGPFGLLVLASNDLTEQTAIFFRIFKGYDKFVVLMCSDQSRSSLKRDVDKKIFGAFVDVDPSQKISLRTLIDRSTVESFGGKGKACITARVYPELAIDNKSHLYAFNYGTRSVRISRLRAWSMKKAQIVEFHEGRKPLVN
ncbi:Beta-fructofuranosidase [Abeliophyllum distichum]|uniref:Beta-fructofuranosidase n=1 Tax=Abeliophyllum distichum TaxID=126358 RepID=A0ABD1UKR4_9LAMI